VDQHTITVASQVSPEEIERRIEEYRREGFKRRAMPHAVYEDPYIVCPWGDCGYRIAAVDFHIEKMGDPGLHSRVISAGWQGPGIAGRCPGCGRFVLFSLSAKQPVDDPMAAGLTVLPDDWHQYAYIVSA
jgi:hypothetical protein